MEATWNWAESQNFRNNPSRQWKYEGHNESLDVWKLSFAQWNKEEEIWYPGLSFKSSIREESESANKINNGMWGEVSVGQLMFKK